MNGRAAYFTVFLRVGCRGFVAFLLVSHALPTSTCVNVTSPPSSKTRGTRTLPDPFKRTGPTTTDSVRGS